MFKLKINKQLLIKLGSISILLAIVQWFFNDRILLHFILADEGFLYFGSLRVLEGELPIVDFRSYDPLRYFWVATWLKFFGTGIFSFYTSLLVIKTLTIYSILWLILNAKNKFSETVFLVVMLSFWLYPRHKIFEIFISIVSIILLYLFFLKPTKKFSFILGISVGLFAFTGRNLGLYSFISFTVAILFIIVYNHLDDAKNYYRNFIGGIPIGYLPMIFLAITNPDVVPEIVRSIKKMFLIGGTNIKIPVPWPWHIDFSEPWILVANQLLIGVLFFALPLFYALCLIVIFKQMVNTKKNLQRPPQIKFPGWYLWAASVFVGFPYLHHAFSRADTYHLTQSIMPFFLGVFSLAQFPQFKIKRLKPILFSFFLIATFFVQIMTLDGFLKVMVPDRYQKINFAKDVIWTKKSFATELEGILNAVRENEISESNMNYYFAPNLPGLYSLIDTRFPPYDIYPLVASTIEEQTEIITHLEINEVHLVLVNNFALDNEEEKRFSRTNNLVWNFIVDHFEKIETPKLPDTYYLFIRESDTSIPLE